MSVAPGSTVAAPRTAPSRWLGAVVAVALGIVVSVLVFAGWIAASASSRQVCWLERQQAGGIGREELPPGQDRTVELGGDLVASGCDTGIPTTDGVLATLALVASSVGAALFAPVGTSTPGVAAR